MKITWLKTKSILLGEQEVREFTILEYKPWFSIKLFWFKKSSGVQDRFHTHAFNAYSFLLYGDYTEECIEDGRIVQKPRSRSRTILIPKDQYHRITRSTGCWTLLVTGPWGDYFKELRNKGSYYQEVECTHGRKDTRVLNSVYFLNHSESE